MASWDEFSPKAKPPPPDNEFALVAARVFGSADGETILKWMREVTIEKVIPASAGDRALLNHEGKRQFVAQIEALRDLGLDLTKK